MRDITTFNNALKFATEKHKGQFRKGTDRPYITHPTLVAKLLDDAGCSDSVVIAGLLHDTIEDTDTTYDEIKTTFSKEVADLVMEVTQTDKAKAFSSLDKKSEDGLRLKSADTISNLMDINADYQIVGEALFDRFASGRDVINHYRRVLQVIKSRLPVDDKMQQYIDLGLSLTNI